MSIFERPLIYNPKSNQYDLDPRTGPVLSRSLMRKTPFVTSIGETEQSIADSVSASKARGSQLMSPRTESQFQQSKRDNPWANQYYSDLRDKRDRRIQAQRQSKEALLEAIRGNPNLTNELVNRRARRQVMPIFRPQIRQTRRTIRQTERQGRRSARDVQGYYDQAGQKVGKMGKSARVSARKAAKQSMSGGVGGSVGNREAQTNAKAMRGMGKANASFFKQLKGALAGEGAVAAADTRRNYKDLANEYRGDLADLQSQRAAAMQQARQQIRQRIKSTANSVYEDAYLGAIQQGYKPRQAQKVALAMAGSKGDLIQGMVAREIRNNKGSEKLLADMQGKKGLTDKQWDRKQDRQDRISKKQDQLIRIMTSPNTTQEQKKQAAKDLGYSTEGL